MSDFLKALFWTAVPIVVLSIASWAGLYVSGNVVMDYTFTGMWLIAFVCLVVAIVTQFVFAIRGKKKTALGILSGVGIGIVAIGVTGALNLNFWF